MRGTWTQGATHSGGLEGGECCDTHSIHTRVHRVRKPVGHSGDFGAAAAPFAFDMTLVIPFRRRWRWGLLIERSTMDNESEYYRRYGKNEKHSFDGVRGPKIPCKYPERGPMLYEVMEYYADATRAMNASHQAMQSTTQSAHDEYVFPRDTRGPPKLGPQGPSAADVDVMLREQAERNRLLQELMPQVVKPCTAPADSQNPKRRKPLHTPQLSCSLRPPTIPRVGGARQEEEATQAAGAWQDEAELSEGQRAEAWVRQVAEKQMRRMRASAGYNPEVKSGTDTS